MAVPFEALPADNRPMAYLEDGVPIYRASAAGACIRALVAARMGMSRGSRPDVVTDAAEAGHMLEPVILGMLKDREWAVEGRQDEFTLRLPALSIRGHIDGRARPVQKLSRDTRVLGPEHIVEIKTMGPSVFPKYTKHGLIPERFWGYCAQIACYHEAYHLPVVYVAAQREMEFDGFGRLTTAKITAMDVRVYERPPLEFEVVKRRYMTAELWARKGLLPGCDKDDFFCGYRWLCGTEPRVVYVG